MTDNVAGVFGVFKLNVFLILVAGACEPSVDSGPPGNAGTGGMSRGGSGGITAQMDAGVVDSGGAGTGGRAAATGGTGTARTGGVNGASGGAGTGGMTAAGGRTGAAGSVGTGGRAGAGGTGGMVAVVPTIAPRLNQCRFHFGTLDSKARGNAALLSQIDFFTPGWIGQSNTFDMASVCTAIKPGGALAGLIPAMVSYIIAFTARRDQGLADCNVSGSNNLCNGGATYIRAHLEDRIIPQYTMYAQGFATSCGTTLPMIWLMEPDYYQYSTGGDPNSLTPQEAGQIMGRLVAIVRQHLPNALFSLDISPWIPNNGQAWYSNFNMNDFAFINTSGGGTDAGNTRIRAVNTMTWAGVHQVTGKPILADTGYGAAGSPTGPDPAWDVLANINARIADGVVGITQYNPSATWSTTITQNRPQLATFPCQ